MRFSAFFCMLLALCCLPVCTFISAPAFAQESEQPLAAVRPYRLSGAGQITSEQVAIQFGVQGYEVTARYEITNPTAYDSFLRCGIPASDENDFSNVSLYVDSLFLPLKSRSEQQQVIRDTGEYEFSVFIPRYWKQWDMQLAPGQTRTVELRYEVSRKKALRGDTLQGTYAAFSERIRTEFDELGWELDGAALELTRQLAGRIARYEASRASGWDAVAGPFTVTAAPAAAFRHANMPPAAETDDGLTWSISHGLQEGTITLEYNPAMTREDEAALVRTALEKHPESTSLLQLERLLRAQWVATARNAGEQ